MQGSASLLKHGPIGACTLENRFSTTWWFGPGKGAQGQVLEVLPSPCFYCLISCRLAETEKEKRGSTPPPRSGQGLNNVGFCLAWGSMLFFQMFRAHMSQSSPEPPPLGRDGCVLSINTKVAWGLVRRSGRLPARYIRGCFSSSQVGSNCGRTLKLITAT